jgi:hypothetical protein
MHDAAEAYLGDMPHPSSTAARSATAFKAAEEPPRAGDPRALRDPRGRAPRSSAADRALLATERRAFSAESWHWPELEGIEAARPRARGVVTGRGRAGVRRRFAELEDRRAAASGAERAGAN